MIPKLDMAVAHNVAVPPDRPLVDMPVYEGVLNAIVAARLPTAR